MSRLLELYNQDLLEHRHIQYLTNLNIAPNVIYDIGACVLHWTRHAKNIWPSAEIILFEAMEEARPFYGNHRNFVGVLSDTDGKEIDFFCNPDAPGGNSYYRENEVFSPASAVLYSPDFKQKRITHTVDTIRVKNNFPPPDFMKIDVQGAELDVLRGATETLKSVNNIVLELQHVEYNTGAPTKNEVVSYLNSVGFELVSRISNSDDAFDADYHLKRV